MSQASLLDLCVAIFDLCFSHSLPSMPLAVPFSFFQKGVTPNGLWPTLMSPFQLDYSCKDPSSKQRTVGGTTGGVRIVRCEFGGEALTKVVVV